MAQRAEPHTQAQHSNGLIKVTILQAPPNRPQTKRFHSHGVERSSRAKFFTPHEIEISNFLDLADVLDHLAQDPCKMIVMGSVIDEFRDHETIRRLAHPRDDEPATLEDLGSCLLHFDADEDVIPNHLGWNNPGELAAWTWEQRCLRLPALREVSVAWQASSSAGTAGKEHLGKFHFWCLADRPLFARERKHLFHLVGSDTSLAGIAQPNYTAFPIFDGVSDPLRGRPRSGILE